MKNFIFWLFYYIKCLLNIIYSFFTKNYYININCNENFIKVDNLYVIKLKGTYYEMGLTYGKEMKKILNQDISIYIDFLKYNNFSTKIPAELKINNNIFDSIINLYNKNIRNYNKDIINFMKGVSDGSKINYKKIIFVNFFTDLMDNHCIILNKKINGKNLNIRTLDYGSPNFNHSLIIFKPINKISYCSLNISCIFGCISGFSENKIFFGETYHDDNIINNINFIGMPFHHASHKILSSCNNINESLNILKNISRTSNLEILLSDDKHGKIFLFNKNEIIDKNKSCKIFSKEKQLFNKNKKYLNNIDNVIKYFIPKTKSGELHCFIQYDNYIYISVTNSYFQSYNNNFYKFDIKKLFN